ncbi:uncharacterized protein LOC133829198 [Humulus lupulus]|uniref:uncharacterized protein LOC133829198 n=1 Tax=Humulus lupulus TaxID=3486 RepID=UPI002B418373|nr:uncharacterized protein LOC133829198 [Humulus lupulus]
MEFDLDNVLSRRSGAKQSKRPRASQRAGSPSKILKTSEETPLASGAHGLSLPTDPNPKVRVSIEVLLPPPPPAIQTSQQTAPPPKKLVPTWERLLSISTYSPEYVIDNAAGKHWASLGSNLLSRVGQSFSNLGAPQWKFLTSCRDNNTLYDKGSELLTSAVAAFAQLKYKLNNEVHSSLSYAQEAKTLQIKLTDELKATESELKSKLEAKDSEIRKRDSKIKELEELNAKLEEEKKATFDIIEGEKARLLEEFKRKKDHAIDMAMYRI